MKVKCTGYKSNERCFTVGKIYEWEDGKIKADDGFVYSAMVDGRNPDNWDLSKYYAFEVVKNESMEIHITTDGVKTFAVLKGNGKLIKRAEAKCNPSDEFDFKTGAELAFNRLLENETKEDKKRFKFKLSDETKTSKFKIGDYVKAIDNHYGITNSHNNWIGRVIIYKIMCREADEARKETARAIYTLMNEEYEIYIPTEIAKEIAKRVGVEVEE